MNFTISTDRVKLTMPNSDLFLDGSTDSFICFIIEEDSFIKITPCQNKLVIKILQGFQMTVQNCIFKHTNKIVVILQFQMAVLAQLEDERSEMVDIDRFYIDKDS